MINHSRTAALVSSWFGCALAITLGACSGSDGEAGGTPSDAGASNGLPGGRPGSSGASGSIGNVSGAGNVAGAAQNGGATNAGGTPGTAGASDNGGTPNSAGGTGGTSAQGGRSNGGSAGRGAAGGGAAGGGAAGGGGGGIANCNVSPVDPNATQQAKNLLCYLYSIYGNHVLSGQQETSWKSPEKDISFYTDNANIKKAPAILGGDFLYTSTAGSGTTTSRAQAYWEAGGIPMIRYHMGAPAPDPDPTTGDPRPDADSYDNSMLSYSSTQCGNVVKAGTKENNSYVKKLDTISTNLLTLQSAKVAVILGLFHETQASKGAWFWWSMCDAPQFIALYTYTYNYLMMKGVHNIVRLMPFSGSPDKEKFPGKALVDITGGDTYGTNPPFASLYTAAKNVGGSTMPLALHETGSVPQPSTMFPTAAPWLLWSVWAGYETMNGNTDAKFVSAYASPYTITRDEVPNLK
jgi:Glycosyl hydrolase family 26